MKISFSFDALIIFRFVLFCFYFLGVLFFVEWTKYWPTWRIEVVASLDSWTVEQFDSDRLHVDKIELIFFRYFSTTTKDLQKLGKRLKK